MASDNVPDVESRKMAWLPGAAAGAFIACNCTILLVALLSVFGVTLVINPHIRAATVSPFSFSTCVHGRGRTLGPTVGEKRSVFRSIQPAFYCGAL